MRPHRVHTYFTDDDDDRVEKKYSVSILLTKSESRKKSGKKLTFLPDYI